MATSDYEQRVADFYSVLKKKPEVYRDSKRHLDRFLSTEFNIFTCV